MYQTLTPNSFKVHLVEFIYEHSEDPTRKISSRAFLIENAEELAHRLNGTIIKGYDKTQADFNQAAFMKPLLFNYMIGNTDWSVENQKNVKFLQKMDTNELILVPYDFDFSALTKSPYWRLIFTKGRQSAIENRVLQGTITNEALLNQTVANFLVLSKTGFIDFENSVLLKEETKREMRQYLQAFFRLLKNKKRYTKVFLKD